jgi:predicted HicB family RNase H-like nuclease
MANADHYTYRVAFSPEDAEYVGTVAEFASLSWLALSKVAALEGIGTVVAGVLEDMATSGEVAPEPIGDRQFSGRFQVRVLPEVHRALVTRAAEQKVSLNRYISDRLSSV